ncbi:hypothetical protein [Mycetocola zhadangensis]|uniref:Uncharacterized protein n=1 Tax=Mycetocola zhadangensis TaxID=1164595 RepID=A0A3L7J6R4_9MICO|nr:hypothetical protein [Mycetocola zhadangensis]RLQ86353.1 hypothetical protein D9V28_05915 [Mycetocola zhadangensis]GGE90448.1 hypothetical protein GCM10011313_11680 [Mycetocola zhadangensis]
MPLGMDIAWTAYTALAIVLIVAIAVVVIRLLLAATRALNAYADDRKLRTAIALDEIDAMDDARSR